MSIRDSLKKDDRTKEHYETLKELMHDLQPLAFLITVTLILATFIGENNINQKYVLFSSILFFLAYIGLVSFKLLKSSIFLFGFTSRFDISFTIFRRFLIYRERVIVKVVVNSAFLFNRSILRGTASSAAADGVGARRSATKSAMLKSVS